MIAFLILGVWSLDVRLSFYIVIFQPVGEAIEQSDILPDTYVCFVEEGFLENWDLLFVVAGASVVLEFGSRIIDWIYFVKEAITIFAFCCFWDKVVL
jgi:hypothetical protein